MNVLRLRTYVYYTMNIALKRILLILWPVLGSHIVCGQGGQSIEDFSATANNGEVHLRWVLVEGFTCNGIDILRSTDSLNFVQIGLIDGVCGSTTEPVSYTFVDASPEKNKLNYYKLDLGGIEESEIRSAEVRDFGSDDHRVFPHPVSTTGTIYFENIQQKLHQLLLYDVRSTIAMIVETNEDYFEIDFSGLPNGIFPFVIYNSATNTAVVYAKLIVRH